jgi:hypothetical protein
MRQKTFVALPLIFFSAFLPAVFFAVSARAEVPSDSVLPCTEPVIASLKPDQNPFPDTDITLEGIAAAELYRRGVISGYPDGTFGGENNVNRAEAAKFLMLAGYGGEAADPSQRFPDTPSGQWYIPYINKAAELGIISGYPDGTFKPVNTINTAEFLKMTALTFSLPQNIPQAYPDVPAGSWYGKYAGAADRYNLFPHRPSGLLQPGKPVTRYEMAIAIYTVLKANNGTGAEMGDADLGNGGGDKSIDTPKTFDYQKKNFIVQPLTETLKNELNIPDQEGEKIQSMSVVSHSNYYAVVPRGYEEVGKAYANDLINCRPVLDNFLGFSFPRQNMVVKIFVAEDDSLRYFSDKNVTYYQYPQDELDRTLRNILIGPQAFLPTFSSPGYCDNSHELTHVYLSDWDMPSFMNEGVAVYSQSVNEGETINECKENGFIREYTTNLVPYVDLVPFRDPDGGRDHYDTAKCFVEELVKTYAKGDFIKDFVKQLKSNPFIYDYSQGGTDMDFYKTIDQYLIDSILYPLIGTKVRPILEKYGITEGGVIVY